MYIYTYMCSLREVMITLTGHTDWVHCVAWAPGQTPPPPPTNNQPSPYLSLYIYIERESDIYIYIYIYMYTSEKINLKIPTQPNPLTMNCLHNNNCTNNTFCLNEIDG